MSQDLESPQAHSTSPANESLNSTSGNLNAAANMDAAARDVASAEETAAPKEVAGDDFPSVSNHPDADVVIYDGNCVFCRGQVRNLVSLDGKNRLAYLSLHDPMVASLCPGLTHDDLMKQMYVVTKSGDILSGAASVRYLTRRLPKLWILVPLLHIPFSLPLWQWVYMQIANRRYKVFNQNNAACDSDGTCDIHFGKK